MAKDIKKETPNVIKGGWKAADIIAFREGWLPNAPGYEKLSKGETVALDENNPIVANWIRNKIIVKE